MKFKIRMSVLAVSLLVIVGSGAWHYANAGTPKKHGVPSIGKMSDSERVVRASAQLERLTDKSQEVSLALVSFNRLRDKQFIRDLVVKHNLHVKQVYFAIPISDGPTTQGGFMPGDDIETAFKNHETNLLVSLEASIESMERAIIDKPQFVVETEKDKEFMKGYEMAKVALRQNQERLAKVKQDQVMYNGVQVEVRNDKALELARTPGIRALEVVSEKVDHKASPMLPEGIGSFTL